MIDAVAEHMDMKRSRVRALAGDQGRWSLFLDIDGTLLGIAPTPDAVHVPSELVTMLDRLAVRLGGAVALLTGRRIADADRLLSPLQLVASGVHGTELRTERDGSIRMLAPPAPADLVESIGAVSALAPGILVEHKGTGMAVHYRNAPEAREMVVQQLKRIVAGAAYDVALRRGRKVVEAVPSGFSKATALTWLAGQPPFKGRVPIMIGDDAGDEAAFATAEQLGGVGLRVAGEHFSKAVADFDGVADVHAWLTELDGRLGEQARLLPQATPRPQ